MPIGVINAVQNLEEFFTKLGRKARRGGEGSKTNRQKVIWLAQFSHAHNILYILLLSLWARC